MKNMSIETLLPSVEEVILKNVIQRYCMKYRLNSRPQSIAKALTISRVSASFNPKIKNTILRKSELSQLPKPSQTRTKEELKIEWIKCFDKIISDVSCMSITNALEPKLKRLFHAKRCIFWMRHSLETLYSETLNLEISNSSTLPGYVYQNKSILTIITQETSPFGTFDKEIQIASPSSPQILFPISQNDEIYGIIQLIRDPSQCGFENGEHECAEFLIEKFKIYGKALFQSTDIIQTALNIFSAQQEFLHSNKTTSSTSRSNANRIIDPSSALINLFDVECVDIFQFDLIRGNISIFDQLTMTMCPIITNTCGVASQCAISKQIINCKDVRKHPQFNNEIDGEYEGPCLFAPCETESKVIWVIGLRGHHTPFTTSDELGLQALIPFIAKSITGYSAVKPHTSFDIRLTSLLKIIPILCDTTHSLKEICSKVEESSRILMESDKAIFYYYDKEKQVFQSKWATGIIQENDLNESISSFIFKKKELVNLQNPAENQMYSSTLDSFPGYENKSLIGSVVSDLNGTCYGVLTAVGNVRNEFDNDDVKIMNALSLIVGLALENSFIQQKCYKYVENSKELVETRKNLTAFVEEAMSCGNISRVTFFAKKAHQIKQLITYGEEGSFPQTKHILAADCFLKKKTQINDIKSLLSKNILLMENDKPHFDKCHLISNKMKKQDHSVPSEDTNSYFIIDKQMIDEETNMIFGVIEAEITGKYTKDADRILSTIEFVTMKALQFQEEEKSKDNSEISVLDNSSAPMLSLKETHTEEKVGLISTLSKEQLTVLFTINFDAHSISTIDSQNMIFAILNAYNLIEKFHIDTFYLVEFIKNVFTLTGTKCACLISMVQMLSFIIKSSRYSSIFGQENMLVMFYAAMLHFIPLFDSISLLDKFNITGITQKKKLSSFITRVIIIKRMTTLNNLRELRKTLFEVLRTHEFDPNESADHMNLLMSIVLVSGHCGSMMCRPSSSRFDFNIIVEEFKELTHENDEFDNIVTSEFFPVFDLLTKTIPSMNFLAENARDNYSKISQH